ncbi:MAG: hypothetical protein OHK0035_38870 [Cyanobacteria bacterium J069]
MGGGLGRFFKYRHAFGIHQPKLTEGLKTLFFDAIFCTMRWLFVLGERVLIWARHRDPLP